MARWNMQAIFVSCPSHCRLLCCSCHSFWLLFDNSYIKVRESSVNFEYRPRLPRIFLYYSSEEIQWQKRASVFNIQQHPCQLLQSIHFLSFSVAITSYTFTHIYGYVSLTEYIHERMQVHIKSCMLVAFASVSAAFDYQGQFDELIL